MEPFIGSLIIGDTVELQSRTDSTKFYNATVRGIISDLDDTEGNVLIRLESGTGTGFFASESDDSEGIN